MTLYGDRSTLSRRMIQTSKKKHIVGVKPTRVPPSAQNPITYIQILFSAKIVFQVLISLSIHTVNFENICNFCTRFIFRRKWYIIIYKHHKILKKKLILYWFSIGVQTQRFENYARVFYFFSISIFSDLIGKQFSLRVVTTATW